MGAPLRPLSELEDALAKGVICLFSDIDDTISRDGRIEADAYDALWRAAKAGLKVVPVTGRPAGWCDHIARMWPVHGVIGENGGLIFRMEDGRMRRDFLYDDATRAGFRQRLDAVREEILREVPGTKIASDQSYREYDLAIDFCEDVPALPREDVLKIQSIFEAHGATAKISSIHVNGWYGEFDKLSSAKSYMQDHLGLDPERDRDHCFFAGDSPNDEPMFEHFTRTSVGVADLQQYLDLIQHKPAWITRGGSGHGFTELVDRLLKAQ
jgi:HAD superfamily hydrolase (TIGR01484 family)